MLDVSLLKDPVFMLIGISNFFGMAGLYVPFFYLVDCAKMDVSIFKKQHFFYFKLTGYTYTGSFHTSFKKI